MDSVLDKDGNQWSYTYLATAVSRWKYLAKKNVMQRRKVPFSSTVKQSFSFFLNNVKYCTC